MKFETQNVDAETIFLILVCDKLQLLRKPQMLAYFLRKI